MDAKDLALGLRVRVATNDLTALVVGRPEFYTSKAKLVRIKYEDSTRYETITNHLLTPLPVEQQYPAFGGTHSREVICE